VTFRGPYEVLKHFFIGNRRPFVFMQMTAAFQSWLFCVIHWCATHSARCTSTSQPFSCYTIGAVSLKSVCSGPVLGSSDKFVDYVVVLWNSEWEFSRQSLIQSAGPCGGPHKQLARNRLHPHQQWYFFVLAPVWDLPADTHIENHYWLFLFLLKVVFSFSIGDICFFSSPTWLKLTFMAAKTPFVDWLGATLVPPNILLSHVGF
jgi:hypothetical protein